MFPGVTLPCSAFFVVILALKTQWVADFVDVEFDDVAVGPVMRRPDDFSAGVGQFLRGAQVVELAILVFKEHFRLLMGEAYWEATNTYVYFILKLVSVVWYFIAV